MDFSCQVFLFLPSGFTKSVKQSVACKAPLLPRTCQFQLIILRQEKKLRMPRLCSQSTSEATPASTQRLPRERGNLPSQQKRTTPRSFNAELCHSSFYGCSEIGAVCNGWVPTNSICNEGSRNCCEVCIFPKH